MTHRTRVDVSVADGLAGRLLPPRTDVKRWALAALAAAGYEGEVSIRWMAETDMRDLNARYRGMDKPTNVLSFPAGDAVTAGQRLLGDVALCAPVIAREAQEQSKSLSAHSAHLVVHGVLHLVGYDHERKADAAVMESREVEILLGLGVDNPYGQAAQ